MDKLKMHSPDLTQDNIAKLAELFPNCVTEAQGEDGTLKRVIDFDHLRQELADHVVDGPRERYQLNWPGKKKAILAASAPVAATLRPRRSESVDFDTTKNLFIEGDNLDALKILQETYLNKVDLIYIDPPYNTGEDLIYEDNFSEHASDYLTRSQQVDEVGQRLVANTEANGRFHSDWLSMMLPRLKLARNLLSSEGVVFISIDDEEVGNLRAICDEVFGVENFVNAISINMKNIAGASGGGEDKRLKKNIEYALIYVRDYQSFQGFVGVSNYVPLRDLLQTYKDEEKSWKYTSVLVNPGLKEKIGSTVDGEGNEISIFTRAGVIIKSISSLAKEEGIDELDAYEKYADRIFQTQMPQSSIRPRVMERVAELGVNSDVYSIEYIPRSGRNKGQVYEQFYKGDAFRLFAWFRDVSEVVDGRLCKKEALGNFWDFASETKNLAKEGGISFPNGKKPLAFIERIISMHRKKEGIVLDFFAGSSTTAHAVMSQNAKDGGSRRFIMVQAPESCSSASVDSSESFLTIADLSKERIRRSGSRLKNDSELFSRNLDIGFRVLNVDASNMKDVYYAPDILKKDELFAHVDNIKEDRTPEDLLFQVLLDWGVDLSLSIEKAVLDNKVVFFVDQNALAACFDTGITEDLVKKLATRKPMRVVFRDSGFSDDSVKINVEQIFKLMSPGTEVKSI
ncbi:MAG: site-specific DNA-methyltransferase [Pirellulales bacterium]